MKKKLVTRDLRYSIIPPGALSAKGKSLDKNSNALSRVSIFFKKYLVEFLFFFFSQIIDFWFQPFVQVFPTKNSSVCYNNNYFVNLILWNEYKYNIKKITLALRDVGAIPP